MSISYRKLPPLLQERNIKLYWLKRDKVIGTATLDKIRLNKGHIDTRSIESICKYLNCQPGDFLEYIPDEATDQPDSI